MLGLDIVTAGSLMLLAQSPVCQMPKPADISVVPTTAEVQYDTSQTTAQIQNNDIDTINPYSFNAKSHTNGFMQGVIKMEAKAGIAYYKFQNVDAYCVHYDQIRIDISIEPTIVIPKEVAADACMLAAVNEHEMKHVMVDRKIVNKYAQIMGQKVLDGLSQRGFIAGPFKAADVEQVAARMRKTVGQLVDLEYQKMKIERQEAQQAVDSLEEYQRVNAQCPGFKSPLSSR